MTVEKGVRRSQLWMPLRKSLLVALLVLVFATLLQGQTPARAIDIEQFSSWSEVSDQLSAELQDVVENYQDGQQSSARSAAKRAYNSWYLATNFAKVLTDEVGEEVVTQHQAAFDEIINLAYAADAESELIAKIDALTAELADYASQFDADGDILDPVSYDAARTEQTQADREEFEANRTKTNTGRGDQTWSEVAVEMNAILDESIDLALSGDGDGGADLVNVVYYSYYEAYGFEKTAMTAISGSRVSQVENQFKVSRKAMRNGGTDEEITTAVTELQDMLTEDAAILDSGASDDVNPVLRFFASNFGQAFIIIVREGMEAILVFAAILAYMVKTGNRDKTKWVWLGVFAGLAASALMAVLFSLVISNAGMNREYLEGGTALVAMVMLLFTSNWMLSKSSVESWNKYIKEKTGASLAKVENNLKVAGVWSLASLSFLAVFREGAETVMFYQALFGTSSSAGGIWGGFAVGCLVLLVIFCLIRFTSLRIPIGPFFAVTSVLLAIMVVLFAGGGLHELIEADLIEGTYMSTWPTIDWFGIYPYVETVVFQIVMLALVVGLGIISVIRKRRALSQESALATTDQQ